MEPKNFKNTSATRSDVWNGQSFFLDRQQTGQQGLEVESSRQSVETPIASNKSSNGARSTIFVPIPPPKQPRCTHTRDSRKLRNQKALPHTNHKQGRSQTVRGATNLSKETRLLKSKLDRLFASYQQTVVAASQSQAIQLESLKVENQQLRIQLGEMETETLRQFSELEDCDELLKAMDERRLASHKEASLWKGECEKLTKEVVFLKETIEKYKIQRSSVLPEWASFQHDEKPKESAGTILERDAQVERLDSNKENTNKPLGDFVSTVTSQYHGNEESNPSLIAARGIFGNEIPASFLNTEHHNNGKSFRRKTFHAMTLRSRHDKKYLY